MRKSQPLDSDTALPANDRKPVQAPGLPRQSLEHLLGICRRLSTTAELETSLQALIVAAAGLTACEAASMLELDEGGDQLRFLALPPGHRDLLKTVKIPLQTSVAGWVFQNGKPALIPDVNLDPRHFKDIDQAVGFVTRSLMAVPIIHQRETIGVLEVVNKTKHAHYTEEDRTILETIASQAALVLQNARLQAKVQRSLDLVAQLDHMKSDFIAITSHELRTPLGLILGYSTFLREDIQPEHRPQMDIIVRNALRLKEIIDNITNMDNVQRGEASLRASPISIKRLIEEVRDSFQQEAQQKQVTLRSEITSSNREHPTGQEDLLVEADPAKISVALGNMLKNAITFTNPGGHIFIVAGSIPGYVKVSVIDDGIGIPPGDLGHIFERFYQVESHLTRKHGGMGLGLSISKVIIEMHAGRIWAESVEGKGSNFTFILPIKSGQSNSVSRDFIS
jgi:signal transduction histidine kinase